MFYIREMGIENINVVDIREKVICGAVCIREIAHIREKTIAHLDIREIGEI